jgi:hypothetical protein
MRLIKTPLCSEKRDRLQLSDQGSSSADGSVAPDLLGRVLMCPNRSYATRRSRFIETANSVEEPVARLRQGSARDGASTKTPAWRRSVTHTMSHFALLTFLVLFPGALCAETGCPANIKAIPLQRGSHHQIVVSVSLNHWGPYDFLLDTGTQMTVIDLSLAADLHLTSTGNARVAGMSFQGPALFARLDRLKLGDHVATRQSVLLYNMKNVQGSGFAIRGLLGEDFLSRYDVLIDKAHNVLCIDDTGEMLKGMNGQRVRLTSATGPAASASLTIAAP